LFGLSLPGVTGVLTWVEMAENAAIAGRGRRDRPGTILFSPWLWPGAMK